MGKGLLKDEFGRNILSQEYDITVEEIFNIDRRGKVFQRDYLEIINIYFQILCFSTEIRGPTMETTFKEFLVVVLPDDVLEGVVGQGYIRELGMALASAWDIIIQA